MHNLYTMAVQAIRTEAERKQAELDATAQAARAALIVAMRAGCVEGVDPSSPAYAVCSLVAQTVEIGREDGYPKIRLPDTTRAAVKAAVKVGILDSLDGIKTGIVVWHRDCSGTKTEIPEWQADYDSWSAADHYREQQTWRTL